LFEREAQARVPMNSRAKPRAPESAPPPIPVQNPKLGRPSGVWGHPAAGRVEHYTFVTVVVNT